MSIETKTRYLENQETFRHNDAVIVSPGFNNPKNGWGLYWDTRLRLLAAASLYKEGLAPVIVVGGARFGNMKDSFANLMKNVLINKYKIPSKDIIVEEDTFDTASQLEWITKERKKLGDNVAIITDSQQKKHFLALFEGFEIKDVDILSSEDVVVELSDKNEHVRNFIYKLHNSPYWYRWKYRESILALVTRKVDKRGEKLGKLTKRRLKEN